MRRLEFSDTFSVWRDKINELVDDYDESTATGFFAYLEDESNGLSAKIKGGRFRDGSIVETISDQDILLSPNSTLTLAIYKEDEDIHSTLEIYPIDELPDRYIVPIAVFETNDDSIIQYTDLRTMFNSGAGGRGSSAENGILMFEKLITESVHVEANQNALSVGAIVDDDVEVTMDDTSSWVIL